MARRPPTISMEDRLRTILGELRPELDADEEAQYVVLRADGTLSYRPPPASDLDTTTDDDEDAPTDEGTDDKMDDVTPDNTEGAGASSDSNHPPPPPPEDPPPTARGRVRTPQTRRPTAALDPASADYDYEADLDQWAESTAGI